LFGNTRSKRRSCAVRMHTCRRRSKGLRVPQCQPSQAPMERPPGSPTLNISPWTAVPSTISLSSTILVWRWRPSKRIPSSCIPREKAHHLQKARTNRLQDVRSASAVVLENIYKDAGLQTQAGSQSKLSDAVVVPNGVSRVSANSRTASSPLASLHHDLVTPSHQQQRDQIFSLSVDQYSHITSDDCFDEQQDTGHPPRRRNLGDALAAMRAQKQGPAGEVYTRSLLLDKVPADVVRDFARMMEDSKRGEPLS